MSMTIKDWLNKVQTQLKDAGIATARLDCLVLLEDEIGKDRAWLLSHPEFELQGSVLKKLNTKVVQRVKHVPLAYIRGKAEFYGREFAVNAHTLVPRPETETIIDLLKALIPPNTKLPKNVILNEREGSVTKQILRAAQNDGKWTLVDIGTGSGAIAITAKLEFPAAKVIATDIDENCLATARANATNLSADITFLPGNLLEPVANLKLDTGNLILLCNLPYVPDNFQINRAATHEPRHALFGGPDGLDLYRKLFTETANLSRKPQYIMAESLPPQHESLAKIAKAAGYSLETTDDFIQVFRKYF